MSVTEADICGAVSELGLSGHAVCVHSSLRSFGWVKGGADTVIDALLAEGCTVLVPTMTWDYVVSPPVHLRPERNGKDYEALDREHAEKPAPGAARIYSPESNDVRRESMGAIPATLLQRRSRHRGRNPMGSFAAVGPFAEQLIRDQTASDPFAHFREFVALNGSVVLMGVGLDRMTLLHHAESLAGRNLFMRWANGPDGVVIPVFGGGCSSGFRRLEPHLATSSVKQLSAAASGRCCQPRRRSRPQPRSSAPSPKLRIATTAAASTATTPCAVARFFKPTTTL